MTTAVDQELSKFRSCSMVDSVDELDEPVKLSFFEELQQRREEYLARAHFYLTIFFSLLAICTAFVFVFLVAFVIEPAVTTMQMDFKLSPATCCVRSYVEEYGADNCAEWSSCREGCTREVYQCAKITVAYTERDNVSCSGDTSSNRWLYDGARLFPNVKGCGYPPSLNCTVFTGRYGDTNSSFPCYYSRVDRGLVLTALDTDQLKQNLIIAIVVPFICLVVSITFLVHAYYRARASRAPEAPSIQAGCEGGDGGSQPPCSKAPSVYSLRSISSRLNTSVVRFARDRYCTDSEGDQIELQPIDGDVDECQFLQPGRLPVEQRRHLLPPLESGGSATDDGIYRETSS